MEHDCLDCVYPRLLSVDEVAELLDKTRQHISLLCRSGDIVAQQISGRWVITPKAVELYKAKPKNGRGKYPRKPSK